MVVAERLLSAGLHTVCMKLVRATEKKAQSPIGSSLLAQNLCLVNRKGLLTESLACVQHSGQQC